MKLIPVKRTPKWVQALTLSIIGAITVAMMVSSIAFSLHQEQTLSGIAIVATFALLVLTVWLNSRWGAADWKAEFAAATRYREILRTEYGLDVPDASARILFVDIPARDGEQCEGGTAKVQETDSDGRRRYTVIRSRWLGDEWAVYVEHGEWMSPLPPAEVTA